MLTREDETELLTTLHEGLLEQPLWSTFLARLRARTGAAQASLVLHRGALPATDPVELTAGAADPPEPQRRWLDGLFRREPLLYRRLRPGRVFALAELLDPYDPAHRAFARDSLAPLGVRDLRAVHVAEPGGHGAWLTLRRGERDFTGADAALLGTLAEHLRIALRTFAALEREKVRAGLSADMVRRLNFCWLTLDARGRVLDADAGADTLLRGSPVLRKGPHGRLLPAEAQAERALTAALHELAAGGQERPRAVHLSSDPWLDMLLVPARTSAAGGAVATAFVHGEGASASDRSERLRALFGLNRGEARLALAISRGRRIAEAADELGLTLETARNYSKRIYSKTGTRGQADLVRLILASGVMLG